MHPSIFRNIDPDNPHHLGDISEFDDVDVLRVYIAGPMTGIDHFNYPSFYEAHDEIRANNDGVVILSPAHDDDGEIIAPPIPAYAKSHDFYLRQALAKLLEANAIYMLPGWEKSTGARLELTMAKTMGMELFRHPNAADCEKIELLTITDPPPKQN